MALPLCAVDIWCVFLSLCAQISNKNFFHHNGVDEDVGIEAIDKIYALIQIADPISLESNPIEILELMRHKEEIEYVPFLFGYSNYSRIHNNSNIKFSNVFSVSSSAISLLGGVGIAISTHSKYIEQCVVFSSFVSDPQYQSKFYYWDNGQPAYLSAWKDENINKDSNNFFIDTLDTLRNAYVRPRLPKFNIFQEKVSKLIHDSVVFNYDAEQIIKEINTCYQTIVL